jgi:hypothetical protein
MEVSMRREGLTGCRRCGELKSVATVDDTSQGRAYARVLCICDGILCAYCGTGTVRRPISDFYDEVTGTVRHTPWFGYLFPCGDCRHREGRVMR